MAERDNNTDPLATDPTALNSKDATPTAHALIAEHAPESAHGAHHGSMKSLVLGAIGIVFGDIGTSPLYTLKECTSPPHGINASDHGHVLGLLSLIFWAITLVVTVKYLTFIMRADNRGEGGILALLALLPEKLRGGKGAIPFIALLVIAGAALLYGDGMITPAISVLSAIEGLEVATESLKGKTDIIVGITCAILVGLFAIQRFGTAGIGKLFGPVMVLWFLTIGGLGLVQIVHNPEVLKALSPTYAISLMVHDPKGAFLLLGSVVLAVTGGEALYADMGHFGAKAIRLAWMFLAMPALVLCYFGQGAILLAHPEVANESPFYALAPTGIATFALVGLAGMATIIASQALISGAFSLTHQAVQLGFFPRVTITHTSKDAEGQIYIPEINWLLGIACIGLVLGFRESGKLAGAYGIAVTGTMGITSIVYYTVARQTWGWSQAKALPVLLLFLAFDIPFFLANAAKFFVGGYVPILFGAVFFTGMIVWRRGRRILAEHIERSSPNLTEFLDKLDTYCRFRLPGTGVFMCSSADGVAPVLMHHTSKLRVLHERVVLLTLAFAHVPYVSESKRAVATQLGKGFVRVVASYGFMETPDVPALVETSLAGLSLVADHHNEAENAHHPALEQDDKIPETIYFLGRETYLATGKGEMGPFEEGIFGFLSRNSRPATSYFGIPPEQVIEIGSQIDL